MSFVCNGGGGGTGVVEFMCGGLDQHWNSIGCILLDIQG